MSIRQLLMAVVLLCVSINGFAASCDQQHVNVLLQKAATYNDAINAAAKRHRINPALIKAVITAESCFRNEARSNKGAGGLMQLIPATAKRFGVNDRFDPAENIEGGTRYLRWLLNRYGGSVPHAIAAYNAGEGRVDQYGAAVPFQETAIYSRRVFNAYNKLANNGRKPAPAKPVKVVHRPAPKPENRWQWDEYGD
ncbi:lytic transglycosylase domain-containing protein [Thiothrix nivea]|uniref:Lytic transglycosylase catalytic n=1 Tax=Thiothrix nivea (strain ATCC 35100 / DSM 5205 / JP2) TaxID=870187 RepID=A0A656HAY8_THINJ|nr:lytic transglycosylase domain-containing protein [Thiothrix nivea]EIJ33948.1 Lytic transglycosylase catalytic [Thiothrix nivea DSM 5205]